MSITQQILDTAASLPPEQQQKLLDYAASLQQQMRATPKPWQSARGALAHRGIEITEKDIAEARREMWGNFPKDPV
jgi:TRAP-type C4-dicarboxylate transport system substrate-binding protein